MINVKDHKQCDMFNPFEYLGPKRIKLLESSWAHLFREEILHHLPVEMLFHHYDEFKGRQTKELYAMLGLVLLQQMEDRTDEEAVQQFSFNILWQYALNITDASDFNSYVSLRSLWAMRDLVGRLGLEKQLFENVTDSLAKLFELDSSKQRLDSVHIFSNMAHLGRVRLFVRTIRTFLTNLKRHHSELLTSIEVISDRYEKRKDGQFAVKPSEASKTLQQAGDDCLQLINTFKDCQAVISMSSYQHLVRLFNDQCITATTDISTQVVIKPSKEVTSDSLQNPSDPDAGYCGHKGQGYQMQVMETWSPDKTQPDLITHVSVEPANKSDADALLPAIKATKERDLTPIELLADSLYGSDDNSEAAKQVGVELIAPVMGSQHQMITLADFKFAEDNQVTACPTGCSPQKIKSGKNGKQTAHFDKTVCDRCQSQSDCPIKRLKRSCTISYNNKTLRLSKRRKQEQTPEFIDKYAARAGAEATMSDLDRVTNVKHLRVRSLIPVRVAATLKAAGLNIHRGTIAFKNRELPLHIMNMCPTLT